jgi:hypothetical protein
MRCVNSASFSTAGCRPSPCSAHRARPWYAARRAPLTDRLLCVCVGRIDITSAAPHVDTLHNRSPATSECAGAPATAQPACACVAARRPCCNLLRCLCVNLMPALLAARSGRLPAHLACMRVCVRQVRTASKLNAQADRSSRSSRQPHGCQLPGRRAVVHLQTQ